MLFFVFIVCVSSTYNFTCPYALDTTPYITKSPQINQGVSTNFIATVSGYCIKGARVQVGNAGVGQIKLYDLKTRTLLDNLSANLSPGINNTIYFDSEYPMNISQTFALILIGEQHLGEATVRYKKNERSLFLKPRQGSLSSTK